MSVHWPKKVVRQLADESVARGKGTWLLLGESDTAKTTLAADLANVLAEERSVAVVDSDTGQSHIGPPTTVGWFLVEERAEDFWSRPACGMGFVGDVSPCRHLLQFTTGVYRCVERASRTAEVVIIDTPGFVSGPAANALWWTVYEIIQPEVIIAVQHGDELSGLLAGIKPCAGGLKAIETPAGVARKSAEQRRAYRKRGFESYFKGSRLYRFDLEKTAVQAGMRGLGRDVTQRVAGLRDSSGEDIAVGLIREYDAEGRTAAVAAPACDVKAVCCLVMGDVCVEPAG